MKLTYWCVVSFRCICGIAYFLLFNDNIMVRSLRFYSLFPETTTPHGVKLCGQSSSRRYLSTSSDFVVIDAQCEISLCVSVCVELVEFDCWIFASYPFLLFSGPGLASTLSLTFRLSEWKIPRKSRDSSYSTPTKLEDAVTGSEWRSSKCPRP